MIKRWIPSHLKIQLHLLKNGLYNLCRGYQFQFAKNRPVSEGFIEALQLRQELKPNEAKKRNLEIAINSIESIEIKPNEIFSFWRVVGRPSANRGYVGSRSLINGNIENSIGGGLCQLSGLIYYLSLMANLEIMERYSHTLDIYTEETRFTPLGSDATVVYAYKDLKIRNNLNAPVRFKFGVEESHISIALLHPARIEKLQVEFKEMAMSNYEKEVHTFLAGELIEKSRYKKQVPSD